METIEISVGGMTCEGCERSIKQVLGQLPGVVEVAPNHASGKVTITARTLPDLAAIRGAVEDAGYVYVPPGSSTLPMA